MALSFCLLQTSFEASVAMRTRRDSDDIFEWHRPTDFRDGVELIYYNFCCGCLLGCLWIGAGFGYVVSRNIRSCCGLRTPHYMKRWREGRWQNNTDSPAVNNVTLLPQRRRALTIQPKGNTWPEAVMQRMADQSKSILFSKLPPEIREQIYEYVLFGQRLGKAFHVVVFRPYQWPPTPGRLIYWRCNDSHGDMPCRLNFPSSDSSSQYLRSPVYEYQNNFPLGSSCHAAHLRHALKKPLSLMCACRQIYTEMAEILYTRPHFHFPEPRDILDFSAAASPTRFHTIRRISIDLTGSLPSTTSSPPPRPWSKEWHVLTGIKGLLELRLLFRLPVGHPVEKITFPMLRMFKGLEVFEIVVPSDQAMLWEQELALEPDIALRIVSAPE